MGVIGFIPSLADVYRLATCQGDNRVIGHTETSANNTMTFKIIPDVTGAEQYFGARNCIANASLVKGRRHLGVTPYIGGPSVTKENQCQQQV